MSNWHIIIPESAVNLVTNPSFETNATGWTAGGTNTIARSSAQAFKGAYSGLLTYGNTATGMVTIVPSPSASTTYYFSCWLYVPANWDGGNIYIDAINYASATETINHQYTHGTSPTAAWVYLETKVVFDADVTGTVGLTTSSAPTATRTVYIDAFQMEQNNSHATTYCDGDQPGCKWSGLVHGSTSTRSGQERSGGRVVDFESDYGVRIRQQAGSGMAFSSHKSQRQALMPGAAFQGSKAEPRTLTLLATPLATSAGNLHEKRDDLIDAVKPDLVSGDQEVVLRYTGSNSNKPVQIKAVYDSGLEFGEPAGKIEHIPMRFIAYDPYWYEIGNGSAVLTNFEEEALVSLSRRKDGNWENMGGTGPVNAIAITDQYVYIGGNFLNWDGIANADYIARYDKAAETWSALGTGANGEVWDFAIDKVGSLWAVGAFTSMGGVANTSGVAKWNGSTWSAVGTGITAGNTARSIAIDQSGNIYVGGFFTQMGGIANTAYIAKWNGTAWSALGTGMNGNVYVAKIDKGNNLYAGGIFTTAGGTSANRIAKWNGSAWSALGTGVNDVIRSIAFAEDNTIYISGEFTTANGITVNKIAKWNGTTFKALEGGVSGGHVYFINFIDGLLHIAGDFTTAGNISAHAMAIWNGSSWAHFDRQVQSGKIILNIEQDPYTGYVYVGEESDATIFTSAVNTVTNLGTARAYPKVTIERTGGTSATVAYLKNWTTGAILWLNYALLDSETLTLDFATGGRSIISNIFGKVWRALLKPSDFSEFYLLPGSNDIVAFINPVGSPTITTTITWPLVHLAVDGVA